jgi:chemotaxis protein MotB
MLGNPAGSNPPVPINIFPSGSVGGPNEQLESLAKEISGILANAAKDPEMAPLMEHIALKQTPDGTLIELIDGSDNFLFPVASPKLKPAAILFLSKLAPLLGKLKNKLEIHGHTDARPFDPTAKKSNWDLSFERANEARRVLEQNGVAAGRIVGVQAHADALPYDKKDRYAAQNRRLSILILKIKRTTKPAASGSAPEDPSTQAPAEAVSPEPTPPPAAPAEPGH